MCTNERSVARDERKVETWLKRKSKLIQYIYVCVPTVPVRDVYVVVDYPYSRSESRRRSAGGPWAWRSK